MGTRSIDDFIKKAQERAAEPVEPSSMPAGTTISNRRTAGAGAPTQLVMPYWSSAVVGIPNEILRSSLFNIRGPKVPRGNFVNHLVATYNKEVEITYTGQELRQSPDQDVFLHLLKLAQNHTPGNWIRFNRADMLRALGWHSSKKDYDRLLDTLTRLNATSLRIHSNRIEHLPNQFPGATFNMSSRGIAFSLVSKFAYEGEGNKPAREWRVKLDPELVALFAGNHFSLLSLEVRKQLPLLGKWLHGYLSTHRQPWPFTVSMCIEKSGSGIDASDRRARQRWANDIMVPALEQLKALGFLTNFSFDRKSEKVSVVRAPLFPANA